jgi:HK97 family phage portal protein
MALGENAGGRALSGGIPGRLRYSPLVKLTRAEVRRSFAIDSFVDSPGLTEQLAAVQGIRLDSWSPPSLREALSVPAVFRACTLIRNTVGMLLMEAFRDGVKLAEQPTLVTRPGIDGTPRDFWADSAWGLATRGEFLWRIVDRSLEDDRPRKLMILPPAEVTVAWDERVPFQRTYRWRDLRLDPQDVVHGFFARDPWGLRGFGPLQLCGAALSAAVEAEEWAARFFSEGGVPIAVLVSQGKLTPAEAKRIKAQWLGTDIEAGEEGYGQRTGNQIRVTDLGLKPESFQINPEQGQLLQSRQHSTGNAATMFGINGHLLNYAQSGSSLTYQNVGEVFVDFVRTTLAGGYMVPIEDAISDLLPRGQTSRFNADELYRADIKTQADVYSVLVTAGMQAEEAARRAGFDMTAELASMPLQSVPRIEVPR